MSRTDQFPRGCRGRQSPIPASVSAAGIGSGAQHHDRLSSRPTSVLPGREASPLTARLPTQAESERTVSNARSIREWSMAAVREPAPPNALVRLVSPSWPPAGLSRGRKHRSRAVARSPPRNNSRCDSKTLSPAMGYNQSYKHKAVHALAWAYVGLFAWPEYIACTILE